MHRVQTDCKGAHWRRLCTVCDRLKPESWNVCGRQIKHVHEVTFGGPKAARQGKEAREHVHSDLATPLWTRGAQCPKEFPRATFVESREHISSSRNEFFSPHLDLISC